MLLPQTHRCLQKSTPPEKSTRRNICFQSAKSGAGEQFLLLDCRARTSAQGVFLFTDTVSNATVLRRSTSTSTQTVLVALIAQLVEGRLSDAGGLRFESQAWWVMGKSIPSLWRDKPLGNCKGFNCGVQRGFPGKFESSNLSTGIILVGSAQDAALWLEGKGCGLPRAAVQGWGRVRGREYMLYEELTRLVKTRLAQNT